ncbi:MAG: DUF998 domain-containing protein [Terracidiphilus sp.]
MQRSKTQIALLATGFGGLLFVLTYLILGALAPDYDAQRDTISALEFTTVSAAQRINFLVFGALLCTFAVGLRSELMAGKGAAFIPIVQLMSGAGVIGDAIFIHEPMHLICDLIAFNSALLVLLLFAWRFYGDRKWKGWTTFSLMTALLMMGFLTAFGAEVHSGGPAGTFEKLASLMRTTWSALLVWQLYAGRTLNPSS